MQFQGRVAIVTGASQGIGRAIALALSREGAKLVLVDVDKTLALEVREEIRRSGNTAIVIKGNVSLKSTGKKIVDKVLDKFSRLDILVNNAGIRGEKRSFWDINPELWKKVISTNLDSVFFFSQAAAKAMIAQKRPGRIINIASMVARLFYAGLVPYNASKGGVWTLTGSMAFELAPYGITVNAVAPGQIGPTNINIDTFSAPGAMERILPTIPMGRLGRTEDIANIVVYLASDQAATITGEVVVADGGLLIE